MSAPERMRPPARLGWARVPRVWRWLVLWVAVVAAVAPGSGARAASIGSGQGLAAEVASSIAWGSAGGCVQNLSAEDFGALTPLAGSSILEPFAALPAAQASTNAQGQGVWVGCVTTSTALASVTAQPTSSMSDAQGGVLSLAQVAIGTTNSPPGGECEITAGQAGAGGCSLASAAATLLAGAGAGTSEIDWQYQLDVPANQAAGDYTGGLVTFTATAAASPPPVSPVDQSAPSISPTAPQVGTGETAAPGTWTGSPSSYSYQWQDCSGSTCTAISGATGQTYTPVAGDAGDQLEVTVTATNSVGSASATSTPTSAVTQLPANSVAPVLSTSSPTVGSAVSVSEGTWAGWPAPTFTYQWADCTAQGCTAITGATSPTYTPSATDVGDQLEATVTATNTAGSASATSTPTTVVTQPPANDVLPALSTSSPTVGSAVSVSDGTWSGSPTPTFTYQWADCTAQTCTAITGATSPTYTPVAGDDGDQLKATVTATNSVGSASATSTPTSAVTQLPANSVAPVLSTSSPTVGSAVSVSDGTWAGWPAPTFTYQWADCSGQTCTAISAATGQIYTPVAADAGDQLEATVTATNSAGTAASTTIESGPVSDPNPMEQSLPTATPTLAQQGTPEKATTGTWTNSPSSYSYQWQDCSGSTCTAISGATAQTYTPTATDVGNALQVSVTATNAVGSTTASSAQTSTVIGPAGAESEYADADSGIFTNSLIAEGADGNEWVANTEAEEIQKVTPSGAITSYALPGGDEPTSVTLGPDGNVWFTAWDSPVIGKITPSGQITTYPLSAGTCPEDIVTGPDGNLWATVDCATPSQLVKITPSGQMTTYTIPSSGDADPEDIGVGPNGELWFTESGADAIGQITTSGTFGAAIALSAAPDGLALGPDGNEWVTLGSAEEIDKITAAGQITTYPVALAGTGGWGIAPGPDGAMWFAPGNSAIGRITTSGAVTSYQTPSGGDVDGVGEGPGGLEWFDGPTSVGTVAPLDTAGVPVATVRPTVTSGQPVPGTAISVTNAGTWSPNPASYAYQWYKCTATATCTAIAGATNSSTTPRSNQGGDTLQVAVIATDSTGSGEATSVPTAAVREGVSPLDR